MSWNAHDPNSMTAQASTFSTKTVPHNFTCIMQFPSYPTPPLNEPSFQQESHLQEIILHEEKTQTSTTRTK